MKIPRADGQTIGEQADVRNFGMNAYGTLQVLLLRRLLSEGLRPKHVFVMFYSNDFYNNLDTEPWQPSLAVAGTNVTLQNYPVTRRYVSPFKQFVKKSYLLSSIGYVFDFIRAKRHITRLEETTFPNGAVAEAPRRAMAYCLMELRAVCQEAGSQLCVVYVPAFNDVQLEATTENRQAIKSLCKQQEVRLLDLTESFRQAAGGRPVSLYFPHDAHWKADGHRVAGTVLVDYLRR